MRLIALIGLFLLVSCGGNGTRDDVFVNEMGITLGNPVGTPLNQAIVREIDDALYPDNPDIEGRSSKSNLYQHHLVTIDRDPASGLFDVAFHPANDKSDTILLSQLDLMEWIPTSPEWIRGDEYLNKVCLINQEWNRQQVRFDAGQFEMKGTGNEKDHTVRVDLARNCLNSYLWEIITYTEEDGKQKQLYHGWFDFPHETYQAYFKERSGFDFATYSEHLKDWAEPESLPINFNLLRTPGEAVSVAWEAHNDSYYELTGARKSKRKNIVSPLDPKKIQDFLNDSTVFSTFYPPGCYSRAFPRSTTLGRMAQLDTLEIRNMTSANPNKDELLEITLFFSRPENPAIKTQLTVGGIDTTLIPTRSMMETHKGYKMPMGIGNHGFYESYEILLQNRTSNNPYYALLTDENGNFIDSHAFGIDGPLFHWDDENPKLLHYWILSFERHAYVGHYTIDFSPKSDSVDVLTTTF